MRKSEVKQRQPSDFITIGDVKTTKEAWGVVNTYKTNQRVQGRKLKMPEALIELAMIGGKHEGIEVTEK